MDIRIPSARFATFIGGKTMLFALLRKVTSTAGRRFCPPVAKVSAIINAIALTAVVA